MTLRQIKESDSTPPTGLQEEIHMLRAVIRQARSMADQGQPMPDLLRFMDTFSMACTRLATLLKTERQLTGTEDLSAVLNEALEDVIREMESAK